VPARRASLGERLDEAPVFSSFGFRHDGGRGWCAELAGRAPATQILPAAG
jgi:hypothetical protein